MVTPKETLTKRLKKAKEVGKGTARIDSGTRPRPSSLKASEAFLWTRERVPGHSSSEAVSEEDWSEDEETRGSNEVAGAFKETEESVWGVAERAGEAEAAKEHEVQKRAKQFKKKEWLLKKEQELIEKELKIEEA